LREVTAICDVCGTVFPTGVGMAPGSSALFVGNKAGPCPNCGADGTIPDGFYDFIGETLRVISDWEPERQRRLARDLARARQAPDPRGATVAALQSEPSFQAIAQRLLVPRNAGEFWTLVAAIAAVLALVLQFGEVETSTVVDHVIREQAPTVPPEERGLSTD